MDLYSDVILTRDIEGYGLRAGDVGTVITVPASAVRVPTPEDRPAVRALSV